MLAPPVAARTADGWPCWGSHSGKRMLPVPLQLLHLKPGLFRFCVVGCMKIQYLHK